MGWSRRSNVCRIWLQGCEKTVTGSLPSQRWFTIWRRNALQENRAAALPDKLERPASTQIAGDPGLVNSDASNGAHAEEAASGSAPADAPDHLPVDKFASRPVFYDEDRKRWPLFMSAVATA